MSRLTRWGSSLAAGQPACQPMGQSAWASDKRFGRPSAMIFKSIVRLTKTWVSAWFQSGNWASGVHAR
ncbi:hypothetical protein B9Z49_07335 [Limnohabitans sp. 2KL-51]|nr:hypothetical protein B9Z49_07335 [Limnohabitans sp. 2KL-51]